MNSISNYGHVSEWHESDNRNTLNKVLDITILNTGDSVSKLVIQIANQ